MSDMGFRDIKPNEVEVRVGTENEKGVTLLLYKNARTDAAILDETVGPDKWQCKFYEIKGVLFCSVGILTDNGWIWKDDCGTESNMEAQKGEASDAFKRACFKWGIGRELYTAPFIWVPSSLYATFKKSNGKDSCKDRFAVSRLTVESGQIKELELFNETSGKTVYPRCEAGKNKAADLTPIRERYKAWCLATGADSKAGMDLLAAAVGADSLNALTEAQVMQACDVMDGAIGGEEF